MEANCQLQAPAASPLREKPPGAHKTGRWDGLRVGLDEVEERKITCFILEFNLDSLTI